MNVIDSHGLERDAGGKPLRTPDQVRGRLFPHPALGTAALALLLSAAPAALDAARAQERSGNWLDEITVVGTRTEVSVQDNPASVSVIDQETLQRQRCRGAARRAGRRGD
jgi:outer membrane receptor protein involved in Fe transport